ncbi:N-acetylmuramoyl-L-alanine amidase, partial [Virgibacillus natechei]
DGDSGEHIVELKEDLTALGFANWSSPSQYYGSVTAGVVEDFQDYYNLSVTGIADSATLDKIAEALPPYQNGDKGDSVVKLKEDLTVLGFANWSNPTQFYGSVTAGVVEDFQASYGLPVTGIADQTTLNTIEDNIVKIFLDPGHGGRDSGGIGYGLLEKNVVLDIALEAANVLENQYLGVDVKLSRETDTFIELEDRAEMANGWGADYFVSIHNNAFNGSASGFESYIYNGGVSSNTSEKQNQMHQYLINELGVTDRGTKEANFSVLRNTHMSAILLEYLFIDNTVENTLLKQDNYRDWLGEITADAIAHSFDLGKR